MSSTTTSVVTMWVGRVQIGRRTYPARHVTGQAATWVMRPNAEGVWEWRALRSEQVARVEWDGGPVPVTPGS